MRIYACAAWLRTFFITFSLSPLGLHSEPCALALGHLFSEPCTLAFGHAYRRATREYLAFHAFSFVKLWPSGLPSCISLTYQNSGLTSHTSSLQGNKTDCGASPVPCLPRTAMPRLPASAQRLRKWTVTSLLSNNTNPPSCTVLLVFVVRYQSIPSRYLLWTSTIVWPLAIAPCPASEPHCCMCMWLSQGRWRHDVARRIQLCAR
jgi:hypothetical protein